MDPDTILTSYNRILDVGVVGAVCLLLIAVLAYRERFWQSEIRSERAAHDKTRDALLEEVRSNADTLALVRTQMQNWQSAVDTLLKVALVRKDEP